VRSWSGRPAGTGTELALPAIMRIISQMCRSLGAADGLDVAGPVVTVAPIYLPRSGPLARDDIQVAHDVPPGSFREGRQGP
jgi:hypothetical protein